MAPAPRRRGCTPRARGAHRWELALLAAAVAATGCKVTGDDIEYWKGTVKGPGKIVAVIKSDRYPLELRSQGALALVEMERRDVDGVNELEGVLKELEEDTRKKVVADLAPRLVKRMTDESAERKDGKRGPPPLQVRSKDAAFLLIKHAEGGARTSLVNAVVKWYVEDFNGRSLAGKYSAEQVIEALGAPAAKQLVEALGPEMPQPALVKISELIAELGSSSTKERAGERLVEIQKEMEGDGFIEWLKGRIRKELEQQNPDAEVEDKRVEAIALLNREKFINEGALPAMKHLGDQKVVTARLLEVAEVESDNKAMTERRKRALMALEGNVDEQHLERVLALALGEDNPVPVRDYAFDRVADIGSPKAISRLWPLVKNAEDQRLRWRAGELVLALGGSKVVSQFFGKLPSEDKVEYAPEELEGYATRMSRMTSPPTAVVRKQLQSSDWWKRVIALRFFERKGAESDLAAMKKLTGDKAKVVGPNWQEGDTVADVAKSAIEGLRERLAQPEEGSHQDQG